MKIGDVVFISRDNPCDSGFLKDDEVELIYINDRLGTVNIKKLSHLIDGEVFTIGINDVYKIVLKEDAGKKFDDGKIDYSLLPIEALEDITKVLMFGAKKYGRYNYLSGMHWTRLSSAALRHLYKWIWGQNNDEETGINHLAHACCCLIFLLTYTKKNLGKDDRYKKCKDCKDCKCKDKK